MRPNDLIVLILQRKELELVMEKKKASIPLALCRSGWPQTFLFIFPSLDTVCVPWWPQISRSRCDDGGGYLWTEKYHIRKLRQDI
jgi:hypothetical protein